ncbi:MAG TPA: flavin reductase family protein [Arenicellales bacterium]|nr:flavin reductase family protein [Arenicellales bacterium]
MFYRTDEPHGLPHNPFNAIVVPRPIGWISTVDDDGLVNLAPYSFFNAVAYHPPQVMYASTGNHVQGGLKDSVANIRQTGEFVLNLATWPLREKLNLTSAPAPHGVDEFEVAGLSKADSELVAPPRVAESPVHMECRLVKVVELLADDPDSPNLVVFGHVVAVHIDDRVIIGGRVDIDRLQPISRLGYADYGRVADVFSMQRPGWPLDPPGSR